MTLKRLCTPIIAIVALSFGLIGCGGSQQQLTQPTNSEIASGYSASAWRNVDSKAFTKAQKVSSLKFHVEFDGFSDSKFVGNDFYYEVRMITHGEFSRSRHKIPSDAMGAISRDLATRAALSLANEPSAFHSEFSKPTRIFPPRRAVSTRQAVSPAPKAQIIQSRYMSPLRASSCTS